VSKATGAAGPTPNRTRTIVLGVVVVLLIGAGSFWLLRTVFHVGRHGRVDLIGENSRGIGGAEMFTNGCFDPSNCRFGPHALRPSEEESKKEPAIYVTNNTKLVVLYTLPPRSRVRLTSGEHFGKVVWISTGTIHFDE
jgi:hypothetical protein